jgi:PepB aminopeptidase
MTKIAHIALNTTSSASGWQTDNLVQFIGDEISICIAANDKHLLRKIQKAARKIEALGIEQAKLVGGLWAADSQWAFALGFTCVGKLTNVEFTGDKKIIASLQSKLSVYAWSRDLTNQTPAQLTPLKLAELTTSYLSEQAADHISRSSIAGEA